ncbi:SMP-30/gluconolactonase/LRE family protein [Rubrivivax sp. RP6-9]|uniref:SMP-30/gluconolactonase/LRE family protein n=1 Tax=Rubrivivax sp. RP6-9 TaxID=3415750 RepID=UPI003CC5053A
MNPLALLIQLLVGLSFIARAAAKLFGTEKSRAEVAALRLGRGTRWTLGGLELLGGLAMLASMAQPFLVFFAAVFLVLVGSATALLHAVRKRTQGLAMTALLLAGAVVAALLQPLGLRVLALPEAEALPLAPVASARTVKSYGEGQWLESVQVGPDGTVYLTSNLGENYATGDKRQVRAQVIARAPDGTERVFFELPQGATAGVIAFDAQGGMYMTGQGARLGVWRLGADGKGALFAQLPTGAWPNGITVGPDQQLYVADAAMGVIWRVDPKSGAVSRAIESDALRARVFVALAPGANGLHFFGRDLYVTVSDSAQVLKTTLGQDGRFGPFGVFASGIPGDDFAIDEQGTLYITTHPFNTIVRVTQAGERSIVANATQGVTGATDAAFGVLPGDRDTLYVATDGGAFSGDMKARGSLVALKVRRAPTAVGSAQ